MKILTVIPARGGSKGIPRKNIKMMCGRPLISYVIETLKKSRYNMDIAVSSDDEEILHVAEKYGAITVLRPARISTDEVTLDPVIHHAVASIEKDLDTQYNYVITVQPTSPLLTTKTLDDAITIMIERQYDTIISVVNSPKLSWRQEDNSYLPNYKERVNRQYMDKNLVETGAFLISRREVVSELTRIGPNVSVYEVPAAESVDIDNIEDWWIVEKKLSRKTIMIRVDGYQEIGMGHIYRGLQLIEAMTESNVFFVLNKKSDLGIMKIQKLCYPFIIINQDDEIPQIIKEKNVDIVINDILNTNIEYMNMLRNNNVRIINFEDVGEGAYLADAVINDLYEKSNNDTKFYWGSKYYLIRNEFLLETPKEFSSEVREIVVAFGGTDPLDITQKVTNILRKVVEGKTIHCTIILGLGYKNRNRIEESLNGLESQFDIVQDVKTMSTYMKKADLAISSQGRTMLEFASMAVPTILIAEHTRESKHEFGSLQNGFLNMGIGDQIDDVTLYKTIQWLIECEQIRKAMHKTMLKTDLKHGFKRVKKIIFGEDE